MYFVLVTIVFIKCAYLDIGFTLLADNYMKDSNDYFNKSMKLASVRNGCYIAACLLAYLFILRRFIRQINDEIWQTKGLLNLIPTNFLLANMKMRSKLLIN